MYSHLGGSVSLPGVQESGCISGRLPDDPGGFTCMRNVYLYQKGDYESTRKDTLEFVKEKYFSGHSDTRSVQDL